MENNKFYRWQSVKCVLRDGREIIGLYQYSVGRCHCVWDGDKQFLIKENDSIRPCTMEEDEIIRKRVDKSFTDMFKRISPSELLMGNNNNNKKKKEQSDMEILTKSVDEI